MRESLGGGWVEEGVNEEREISRSPFSFPLLNKVFAVVPKCCPLLPSSDMARELRVLSCCQDAAITNLPSRISVSHACAHTNTLLVTFQTILDNHEPIQRLVKDLAECSFF